MGVYINPGNVGFATIVNGDYVDKTGIIGLMNSTIDTPQKLTCISRPRRFGKSFAAQMICAYYDCTCDSAELFDGLAISEDEHYRDYLNKYNVIYLDITGFISNLKRRKQSMNGLVEDITDALKKDIATCFSRASSESELEDILMDYVDRSGRKFIFIIDEWDSVIREAKNDKNTQEAYLNLLRGWFKNGNFTPRVVAGAYMTGILPIKKDGTESAISDFMEYTILNPGDFAEYTGFTENEVSILCDQHNVSFDAMKEWYDGYSFKSDVSVYNPYSVMTAIRMGSFGSYWQKTSAAEALSTYIAMNYDGLKEDIVRLIAGEHLEVNVDGFDNDIESFDNKDDVITLLIHLGYLAYDSNCGRVRIPNKEVQKEFENLLKTGSKTGLYELIRLSDRLFDKTLAGDEKTVCDRIEAIRESSYAPTYYNDEQALRYVIKFAYISCVDRYSRIEELPSGRGIADVVYIPKAKTTLPAMLIELKWNKTDEAALQQIKNRKYPSVLEDFVGEMVLVGINYDERTKTHTCKIERVILQ